MNRLGVLMFALVGALVLTPVARAIERVEPAPLIPIERRYPLFDIADGNSPTDEDWNKALAAGGFYANGQPEEAGGRTTFRMLRGADRLYVRIEAALLEGNQPPPGPSGVGVPGVETFEFYVTQHGEPAFPVIAVRALQDGEVRVGIARRPHQFWIMPTLYPIRGEVIHRKVSATAAGWRLDLSLPFDELEIPRSGFLFNVVHGLANGKRYAWSDIAEGPSHQFSLYARAHPATGGDRIEENGLALPAQVGVGRNALRLEVPDDSLRLRVGDQTIQPGAQGVFDVVVRDRGPLKMTLLDTDGRALRIYEAVVRRPLIIHAPRRYLSDRAEYFTVDVALATVDNVAWDVTLTAQRGDRSTQKTISLEPGLHTIEMPVPESDGREVRLTARAVTAPAGDEGAVIAEAKHWFAMGMTEEDVNTYRDDIRSLPTDRMYWAVLADRMPGLLFCQWGDGSYGGPQRQPWPHMAVYVPALLYKTAHPDNPFHGDRRLLDSAIMGMEYALRPETRMKRFSHTDSRSPQAFLQTYAILKDDITPKRRAYWAQELKHEALANRRFISHIDNAYTFNGADTGTSPNHMAYHISNLYLAGQLFDHDEWKQVGATLMHRLARHGREGYFPEQKGSPVNHYTWLTANALAEYYSFSNDESVRPTLEACARYMTAVTTAQGGTMVLHDSRTTHHHPCREGDHVLSLIPAGRTAARTRLLRMMGNKPSHVDNQALFRLAETAQRYRPGDEALLFDQDRELSFSHGLIARRHGFHYGYSTVLRQPVSGRFVLDSQNVLELFHEDVGAILHGGNSQNQPEAGTFFRELGESEASHGGTAAATHDYLPQRASVVAMAGGHELGVGYRTFKARILTRPLSPTEARVEVAVDRAPGPVTFNFFPGTDVRDIAEMEVGSDGRSIRFGRVRITTNHPFETTTGFQTYNPYTGQYADNHKPVRCAAILDNADHVVLNIEILPE